MATGSPAWSATGRSKASIPAALATREQTEPHSQERSDRWRADRSFLPRAEAALGPRLSVSFGNRQAGKRPRLREAARSHLPGEPAASREVLPFIGTGAWPVTSSNRLGSARSFTSFLTQASV